MDSDVGFAGDLHRVASFRVACQEISVFRSKAEARWADAQKANDAAEAEARHKIQASLTHLTELRDQQKEVQRRGSSDGRWAYYATLFSNLSQIDEGRTAHEELVNSLLDSLAATLAAARAQYEADCRDADTREYTARQAFNAAIEQPVERYTALLNELLDVKQVLCAKMVDLESTHELLAAEKRRAAAIEDAFKDTITDAVKRRADAAMDVEKRHAEDLAAAKERHAEDLAAAEKRHADDLAEVKQDHAQALEAADVAQQIAIKEAVEAALAVQQVEINLLKEEKAAALAKAAAQAKKRKQWMKTAREADERARRAEARALKSDSDDSDGIDDADEIGEEEDEEECCVCMDSVVNAKLTPCGHRLCMSCATQVRGGGCPTCRGAVKAVVEG